MQTRKTCQSVTRSGRRCRNPAVAGSTPPVCWRHQPQQPQQPAVSQLRRSGLERAPTADMSRTLGNELAVVRRVLQRLVERLDEPAFAVEAEELRKVAALIFNGARTVAYLLQQQSGSDTDVPDWLDEALDALTEAYEVDL